MPNNPIVIRSSPFLFIKRFVVIEFFFAILPFAALLLFNLFSGELSESYEQFSFSRTLSFNLFVTLLITTIQVIIVIIVFISWSVPVYEIDDHQITQKRGNIVGDRKLAELSNISQIDIRQGWLAKNFNYGTLAISTADSLKPVFLNDIPEPNEYAIRIERWIESDDLDGEAYQLLSPTELILSGESKFIEYKSSLAWDYYQQRANKALHQPVMKTLAAFMNSSGGYLLIGVDDDGQVLGLEPDLQTLRKPTLDAFETAFNMAFNKMIGAEFREYVDVAFPEINEKPICMLRVFPSTQPVFMSEKGDEKFYIRAGNASQALSISQANRYIQRRFSD